MNTIKKHETIRVFVETYRKYNECRFAGRWLTLNDYKTPQEFWAACRRVHADERDPEFMFPDYEVPDFLGGLITESYIDTEAIWEYLSKPVEPEEEPETRLRLRRNERLKKRLMRCKKPWLRAKK